MKEESDADKTNNGGALTFADRIFDLQINFPMEPMVVQGLPWGVRDDEQVQKVSHKDGGVEETIESIPQRCRS